MNVADWLILAFVVFAIVQAAISGFFQEAFAIAGLVVGYLFAAWEYERVAGWFSSYVKSSWMAELAGFLLIFAAVMIVAGLAGKLARWIAKEAGLTAFDRFLGGVLGLLKGSLIVSILLVGMTSFAPTSRWLNGSSLAPYFLVVGRAAIWMAPSELRAKFYQGLDLLHRSPPIAGPAAGASK